MLEKKELQLMIIILHTHECRRRRRFAVTGHIQATFVLYFSAIQTLDAIDDGPRERLPAFDTNAARDAIGRRPPAQQMAAPNANMALEMVAISASICRARLITAT